jgi:hypothetical protein
MLSCAAPMFELRRTDVDLGSATLLTRICPATGR